MPDNEVSSIEATARSLVDNSTHYVDSVTAIIRTNDLNATDDIVSSSGIKLVARGTKIDEHLLKMLSEHRLSAAVLEKSVSISGSVTPESLALDIDRLIENDAWFRQLAAISGDPGTMRHGVSRVVFHQEILFRLTVVREDRPDLYRHSLSVAIIVHYLALRLNQRQTFIDNILIAALCHDLGELYTDPAILEPGHRVSDEERRFIYVHPITGWLIARELKGLDPEVAKAIIQHQERLDGSGYPRGCKDIDICLAGRILAAADVSASIMSRFSDHRRLSTLLRLNSKKYDRTVVSLLHSAFIAESQRIAKQEGKPLKKNLADFAQLLEGWSQLRADPLTSETAPVTFLTERMYNLRTSVLAFGFDPDSIEMTLQMAEDDATIAAELAVAIDELQFQLTDLEREIDRHAAEWQDTPPLAAAAFEQWQRQLHNCVNG